MQRPIGLWRRAPNLLVGWLALLLASTALLGTAAFADPAVSPAARTWSPTAPTSGLYIWGNADYQSVGLPNYAVGFVRADAATGNAIAPLDTFRVRATGEGMSFGAGYVFRDGAFPLSWGTNTRVEIHGAWIKAGANNMSEGPLVSVGYQLLGGFVDSGLICVGGCAYGTSLKTDFEQTRIAVRAASDFKLASLTLSPSIEILGGRGNTDQHLTTSYVGVNTTSPLYEARTRLAWRDFGGRVGLDVTRHLLPWLDAQVGGRLGLAHRNVDFTGTDVITDGFGTVGSSSSIARGAYTTALLASAEASLAARLSRQVILRSFAGLEYDSRVPGVAPASYSGSYVPPRQANPAGIMFSGETRFYAGGGISIAFDR